MRIADLPGMTGLSSHIVQFRRRWVGSPAQRATQWWLRTLGELLPMRLQQKLTAGSREDCFEWHDGPMVWPENNRPKKLMLPPDIVLVRTLSLPAVAARNSHEVIGYELDKYMPYPATRVYFATRIMSVDAARVRICMVVILRERLDAILQQAGQANVTLCAIDVRNEQGEPLQIDLLPDSSRQVSQSKTARALKVLSVICVLLIFSLMTLWLQQRQQQLDYAMQQVEQQNQQVIKLSRLRQQLRDTQGAAFWLVRHKLASPTYSQVLADVTACVPVNTWIERLDIDAHGRLSLTGESAATSSLPADFQACKTLTNPRFQGVIQPDIRRGKDQFTLTAEIKKRGEDAQNVDRP